MTLPDILMEDDSLVAFDKPSGLPVSPNPWEKAKATLMGLARPRYGEALANVHRLDAEASGVVLCAKTKEALDFLSGQFQSKTVRKLHSAMVVLAPLDAAAQAAGGVRDASGALPAEFTVDADLGPDEHRPGCVRVYRRRGGKPAETAFTVLEAFGRFAWLECRPLTGRTHQVRVHLASIGAPVLNDRHYGDREVRLLLSDLKRGYKGVESEKPMLTRLALHAGLLGFAHPLSREKVEVVSPLPREYEVALKNLRKFARPARKAG
jgi:23S rRNA-/tRNA-specific pseudouridylate synthase